MPFHHIPVVDTALYFDQSLQKNCKIEHDNFLRTSHITDALSYTDGSGINNKIGASAYLLVLDQTFKLYLGPQGCYYTV